ncbi:hypothetical protein [Frankia sp. Cr1]|uniref:hypothetical protein n=1 Tax=Frankia sp. Cr1 TaxID=3073931 RepID=UPI002AD4C6EE|nr:hypothetical protein [Frankia sp. Cr1]
MSDVVVLAIVSVAVTGLGVPGILALAGRLESRRSQRLAIGKEWLDVLDFAAEQLARSQRTTGQCIGLWSRGIMDNDDEARECLKRRNEANEAARTAYGRLCIRFGPASAVVRHYDEAVESTQRLTEVLRGYRAGDTYDAWAQQAGAESAELTAANERFLNVANRAMSATALSAKAMSAKAVSSKPAPAKAVSAKAASAKAASPEAVAATAAKAPAPKDVPPKDVPAKEVSARK